MNNIPTFKIDTREIFEPALIKQTKSDFIRQATAKIAAGQDLLLMADNDPETVKSTKSKGKILGLDELTVSRLVSATLAEITLEIVEQTNLKRLIIAGGDTSGTLCRKLGITGNIVLQEIEPGLPSGLALGRPMLIVLKSGSFGKPDFLEKALVHLKSLGQ
jgi:Uncharacterized protein conserved in bacteria